MRAIDSPANPLIREARRLQQRNGRRRSGLVLLEGLRLVEDALQAGAQVLRAFYLPEALTSGRSARLLDALAAAGTELVRIGPRALRALSDTQTPQGLVAVARRPDVPPTRLLATAPPLLVVADGVRDPGNLGSMVRSAAAAGASGLAALRGTTDPYGPKALRASAGAVFRLPCAGEVDGERLRAEAVRAGCTVVAADPRAGLPHDELDWRGPVALVVGGEAEGPVSSFVHPQDLRVRVPMAGGVESLNAAAALAVLVFEAARQRGTGRGPRPPEGPGRAREGQGKGPPGLYGPGPL